MILVPGAGLGQTEFIGSDEADAAPAWGGSLLRVWRPVPLNVH
ncbi:hypothetical protein [Actinomyces trachealis]|nr:hypothetical protein [Actinomyces trachealis]